MVWQNFSEEFQQPKSSLRFRIMKAAMPTAAVEHILSFVGYGSLAAPLWFIGLEEGLGGMDDADVAANLVARGKFAETMDLAQSHMTLVEAGRPYDLSQRHRFTQVWLWMARFARALEGAPDWQDIDLAKHYVRSRLGRSDGSTFLTYASPIPEKGLHTRQWTELVHCTGLDVQALLDRRVERIRALIERHRPSIVICHGTSATRDYQSLLPPMNWQPIPGFGPILAAEDEHGFHRFITPFFGVGQMSFEMAGYVVNLIKQTELSLPSRDRVTDVRHVASQRPLMSTPAASGMPIDSARSPDLSHSFNDFSDSTDPACTIRLLDRLVGMGLTNGAFALLHHRRERGERETILGFHTYCAGLQGRFRTASNRLVHERLVYVLTGRLRSTEGSERGIDFETLADRAYRAIPPR